MAEKVDLKRTVKTYFTAPSDDFATQTFQRYSYLMIDGQGSPGEST